MMLHVELSLIRYTFAEKICRTMEYHSCAIGKLVKGEGEADGYHRHGDPWELCDTAHSAISSLSRHELHHGRKQSHPHVVS